MEPFQAVENDIARKNYVPSSFKNTSRVLWLSLKQGTGNQGMGTGNGNLREMTRESAGNDRGIFGESAGNDREICAGNDRGIFGKSAGNHPQRYEKLDSY